MSDTVLDLKQKRLAALLQPLDTLMVAFSGGVDSSLLLAMAHEVLGAGAVAVTAVSPIHPLRDKEAALAFTRRRGIKHLIMNTREMENPDFTANPRDRCYICKRQMLEAVLLLASEKGFAHVAHGANADDGQDYRPGQKAAQELSILAPLADAGLKKAEVRSLARRMQLETWATPAESCLATRFPYGSRLTMAALQMVEKAEEAIRDLGVDSCRVRHYGTVARIEVMPEDFPRLMESQNRPSLVTALRRLGYQHVTLDLEGYVSGSLNRELSEP